MNSNSMLPVSDDRKVQALQNEFTLQFPFLRIMFYNKPFSKGKATSKKITANRSLTISDTSTAHSKGDIKLLPSMKVSTLAQMIWQNYGLLIKVYRKSGDSWADTTTTSSWTLGKQNSEGKTENNTTQS